MERLTALGAQVLQQDSQLEDLRRQLTAPPPELATLSEENTRLAQTAHQVLEDAAELSAAHGHMETEATQLHSDATELQRERDELQERLARAEASASELEVAASQAQQELDLQRLRSEDRAKTLADTMERHSRRTSSAEATVERLQKEAELRSLRERNREERERREEESVRYELEQRRSQLERLESRLVSLRDSQARGDEALLSDRRRALESQSEAKSLELAAEALANEVAASERSAQITERRALGVARELLETSQAISSLRSEAASRQNLRWELEEARQEEHLLDKRLELTRRGLAWHSSIQNQSHSSTGTLRGVPSEPIAAAREPLQATPPLHSSPATESPQQPMAAAAAASASSSSTTPANDLRKVEAIGDALRAAWEAERKAREDDQAAYEDLLATWAPMRDSLVQLTTLAKQFQGVLMASGGLPEGMPAMPPEHLWSSERLAPSAAKALCDILEVCSQEGCRRLAMRPGSSASFAAGLLPPAAANSWAGTPNTMMVEPLAADGPASASASASASARAATPNLSSINGSGAHAGPMYYSLATPG